jgi:hypothetical protein
MQPRAEPIVGLAVVTIDERPVGAVEATDSDSGRVCIRPRRGAPYWIDDVLVRCVKEDRATLHVDARTLQRYRRPAAPRRANWFQRTTVSLASLVSVAMASMFLS